jgi:hypothetical protein
MVTKPDMRGFVYCAKNIKSAVVSDATKRIFRRWNVLKILMLIAAAALVLAAGLPA